MMKINIRFRFFICALVGCQLITACADFIDINGPATELTRASVFSDDATAEAAMLGVYVYANNPGLFLADGWHLSDVAYITGRSADELKESSSANVIQFAQNEVLASNGMITTVWTGAYKVIYQCNAILEGVQGNNLITQNKRAQLEGEARFIRAFTYFYLVNLFGDVPLVTTTDYRINAGLARTAAGVVYQQIVSDLEIARQLLPATFGLWNGERIRPTAHAATAMLARVALYLESWSQAEDYANQVINQSALFQLKSDLNEVFLKNSTEAIWQCLPIRAGLNSPHGETSTSARFSVQLRDQILTAFEPADQRALNWVGIQTLSAGGNYKFTSKYKAHRTTTVVEYTTNLRLAEQYLIRAEARVQQNKMDDALEDINQIRTRAGLTPASTTTPETILELVRQERRVELFVEGGHRWLDLKRWGIVNEVIGTLKSTWQPTDHLYPIPATEINRNQKLIQNDGYDSN
ncbi:MAG TPA: RagB/SusD family nutrient uptake outer membrane protein [Cytophagales bacterium]|nr:RagB/SusD family nutrient uptake outer membrane protein [Cytophagales bacterium]